MKWQIFVGQQITPSVGSYDHLSREACWPSHLREGIKEASSPFLAILSRHNAIHGQSQRHVLFSPTHPMIESYLK
jgi:hypothetical protein